MLSLCRQALTTAMWGVLKAKTSYLKVCPATDIFISFNLCLKPKYTVFIVDPYLN